MVMKGIVGAPLAGALGGAGASPAPTSLANNLLKAFRPSRARGV